jgi:hypothetical protein
MSDILNEIRKLRRMKDEELRKRYLAAFGEEPPKRRGHGWLWKRLAWRLQADAVGEPAPVVTKTVAKKKPAPRRKPQKPDLPLPGTTLVRNWRGKNLELRVLEDGFELDGVVHRTLSAAAKAVTGAHWNGKLFWGLTTRKRGKK